MDEEGEEFSNALSQIMFMSETHYPRTFFGLQADEEKNKADYLKLRETIIRLEKKLEEYRRRNALKMKIEKIFFNTMKVSTIVFASIFVSILSMMIMKALITRVLT